MRISKNLLLIGLMSLAIITSIISCGGDDTVELVGNWVTLPDFKGDARQEAVAFSIGNIGYVGTGSNGTDLYKDFYSYDAVADRWTSVDALPDEFVARTNAVAFSAAGKGFVGTGRDQDSELKDFWSYNPDNNEWTRVADIPVARYGAVAFSINNIGYVGTGYNGSTLLDFYSYNPETNTWNDQIAGCPTKVREAVAFVLDNKGYVVTGEKNGISIDDFYAYDPVENNWEVKRKVANVSSESYDNNYSIVRKKAVAFTIGGKAYVTTGDNGSLKSDVWEYDPATDLWTNKSSFEKAARNNAVAFSTENGRGFVCTGVNGASGYFDDTYEFKPNDVSNEDD